MNGKNDAYRTVYSTDTGTICPNCSKPQTQCNCTDLKKSAVLGDGKVRVRREVSGRKGKTVTTVRGLAMNATELETTLKELKKRCGSGGTVKDGVIEIQGEHIEGIVALLIARGIKAKAG